MSVRGFDTLSLLLFPFADLILLDPPKHFPNSPTPDGEWIVTGTIYQLQVVNVKTGLMMPLPWSYDYSSPDWKPR